jgi:hypothetical protein
MKTRAMFFLCALVLVYMMGYVMFRQTHIKKWDKDGHDYVIFPKTQMWMYYTFRPITIIDSKVTGMGFHIGPHR